MSVMELPYSPHVHVEPPPDALAVLAHVRRAEYPGGEAPALYDVSARVPVGARVALVGPNGAGKSTLLKLIAGLLAASDAEVLVYGLPVNQCRHRVAYLPQRAELDWHFPVSVERLAMAGRFVHMGWLKRPGRADRAIVRRALERLGIAHLAKRQIGDLSGGQQQRALLARALAQEAELLLLDEPLNAVDTDTRAVIAELMAQLHAERKTVLVATHDLGRLESDYDGALYLCEGHEVPAPPGSFFGLQIGDRRPEAAWTG
jgi:manganese/zinc/iron transport system ATP- binding protein